MIIISSSFGEILKIEFKPKTNFEPVVTLFSDSHSDVIFSMACPSYVEYNKYYLKFK